MNTRRLAVVGAVMLLVVACFALANAQAAVTTMTAYPTMVSDETQPRGIVGDFPTADWGTSCWQGPVAGPANKSNFHVRQDADGSYFNLLFGDDPVYVSQLDSLSYWTKRDTSIGAGKDWWMTIYTFPETGDTDWYHSRINSNYGTHAAGDDAWHEWQTSDGSLEFVGYSSFDALKTALGTERLMSITIQTNTGWNGFDGYVDGITIALTDGRVGQVNLEAVPEPATLIVWSLLGAMSWLGMRVWRGGQRIARRSWSPEDRQAILEIVSRRSH